MEISGLSDVTNRRTEQIVSEVVKLIKKEKLEQLKELANILPPVSPISRLSKRRPTAKVDSDDISKLTEVVNSIWNKMSIDVI